MAREGKQVRDLLSIFSRKERRTMRNRWDRDGESLEEPSPAHTIPSFGPDHC